MFPNFRVSRNTGGPINYSTGVFSDGLPKFYVISAAFDVKRHSNACEWHKLC